MSEDSVSAGVDRALMFSLPKLTKSNWHSEFKDAFLEYALTVGAAGDIVINGQNIVMAAPLRQNFLDNQRGDGQFEKEERRYKELMDGKKKLLSKLLSSMDKEVKNSLTTSAGYAAMYAAYDIHGIWNLTEQVVTGRGAISV